MYRMLIVDDEGLELNSLKMIMEKEFGEEISLMTGNSGRAAIEIFENFSPEIVIMDIQMPGINGLDAIAEIRKNHTGGKFLMLTAYDNFDYIQKAMSLGVEGYVTKPFNRQNLIGEVRKIMTSIDKERSQRREGLLLKEKLDAAVPMLEAGLIYSLLLRQKWESVTENYIRLLGIEQPAGFFVVMDYQIDDDPQNSEKIASYSGKVNVILKEVFRECVSQQMGNRNLTVVFTNLPQDEYASRLKVIGRVSELHTRVEELVGMKVDIGIGTIVPLERLADSYNQAISAIGEKSGSVAHFSDLPIEKKWEEGYPQDVEYAMYDAAEEGDTQLVIDKAEEFFSWMKTYHSENLNDIKLKVLELVMRVEYVIFHTGGITYHFMSRHGYLDDVNEIKEIEELGQWYIRHIQRAVENITETKEEVTGSSVGEAKSYIEEHYMENISLNDIAELVHISPFYFSKLFKDKTGRNFIEYLTAVRMEAAKEKLLKTDLSVKEICLSVGYSDPNYFSRSFKKYEGMTPGEYREEKA